MAVMATALPARRASRTISWKEAGREGEEGRGGGEEKEEEWEKYGRGREGGMERSDRWSGNGGDNESEMRLRPTTA